MTDDPFTTTTTSTSSSKKRKRRTWEDMYAELKEHYEQHGSCNGSSNQSLRTWMSDQRKKRQTLTARQVGLLNAVGFDWSTIEERNEQAWQGMFTRLCKFKEQHGHANVSATYRDDPKLGTWVNNQRQRFRQGHLREDRKEKLVDIGLDMLEKTQDGKHGGTEETARQRAFNEQWKDMYERLLKFKQKHGHITVPRKYDDDPQLAYWIGNQRSFYRTGKLRADRKEKLESIGFRFSSVVAERPKGHESTIQRNQVNPAGIEIKARQQEYDEKWQEKYERLLKFKQKHGHTNVPQKYVDDPQLAAWVANQRSNHRTGKLRVDRQERLESIGFRLRPVVTDGSSKLASTLQKQLNASGTQNNAQQNKYDEQWENKFERLLKFKQKHGHADVPTKYDRDPQLSSWVSTQRSFHRSGKLRPDRKEKLESIGFRLPSIGTEGLKGRESAIQNQQITLSQDESQELWDKMFDHLCRYKIEHGNCDVSQEKGNGKDLALWVQRQQDLHSRNALSGRKVVRLSAVGLHLCADKKQSGSDDPPLDRNAHRSFPVGDRLGDGKSFREDETSRDKDAVSTSPHIADTDGPTAARETAKLDPPASDRYVGRRIAKYFGESLYKGTVIELIPSDVTAEEIDLWNIKYDDGDEEDLDELDVTDAIALYSLSFGPSGHS